MHARMLPWLGCLVVVVMFTMLVHHTATESTSGSRSSAVPQTQVEDFDEPHAAGGPWATPNKVAETCYPPGPVRFHAGATRRPSCHEGGAVRARTIVLRHRPIAVQAVTATPDTARGRPVMLAISARPATAKRLAGLSIQRC